MGTLPSLSNANPVQNPILKKSDLDDESLTLLNQILANHTQSLNNLLGVNGQVNLYGHLNLNGKRITNVGAATSPSDVVTQAFGDNNYGAAAITPKLEAMGKSVMQTYRRLSDQNQRERSSSFLNDVLNTAPTSNTSIVTAGAVSGGVVPVTVTSGFHQRVDGSIIPYTSRTDSLALPTTYAISTLSRGGGSVLAVTSSPNPLGVNDGFTIAGTSDSSFDGTFIVQTIISPTSFTYFQGGATATSTGGTISIGGVYYYTITRGQSALGLVNGAGSVDTTSNRIAASRDGTTIIAVVVVTGSGVDTVNSAGGASPQQTGSTVAILRRL